MLKTSEEIIFWTSLAALAYVYAGYPIVVWFLSILAPKRITRSDRFMPKVSVIITAYNEERDIRDKLANTLLIDYPADRLEIIVASDCSTDGTDEIVKEFPRVTLFRQSERLGKTMAQNAAVLLASGEIILFSDATTMYEADVLKRMLPNFADSSIGCVAGRLIYVDASDSSVGKGARGYWSYETFLKKSESLACSLIGASGCLYAVRRAAYKPMYAEACSDFLIATMLYEQGLRTVYEPTAVCREETNRAADKELKMRVRVISQTFTDLWRNRKMMNPLRSGFFAVELISHKLMRYAVPVFLALLFVSSISMSADSPAFMLFAALQSAFYLMAVAALVLEKNGTKLGLLSMPLYFVLANLASLMAFYKFLTGERFAKWEPVREVKLAGHDAREQNS
jgi:cellulose synthase/poly-beta-1,6-N-acetylglucosamine synthase-like glycosyltransferase